MDSADRLTAIDLVWIISGQILGFPHPPPLEQTSFVHAPQSLQYYFRILDVRQQNYLDAFTLNFFFRDIIKEMEKHNQEPVKFEDVKDEIFDMVRPDDPLRITLKDLIRCGNGDTVVSILVDLNGFWTYENREVLIADPESSDM